MEQKIGEFEVQTDDGQIFTIYEYQEYRNAGTHDNRHTSVKGMKRLATSNGLQVGDKGDGPYEIVGLGLKVRRIP